MKHTVMHSKLTGSPASPVVAILMNVENGQGIIRLVKKGFTSYQKNMSFPTYMDAYHIYKNL